jgi:hypothetical protein
MVYRFTSILALALLVILSGCDSGDPINEPRPADVAGTYSFAELRFVPDASATQPADVRARMNTAVSNLGLSSGGNFVLRYEFVGDSEYIISGDFDVRATTVRVRGRAADRSHYQRLLLDNEFTLNRDAANPTQLSAQIQQRVNLEAFDQAAYRGLTDVPGRLHIRLEREQAQQ